MHVEEPSLKSRPTHSTCKDQKLWSYFELLQVNEIFHVSTYFPTHTKHMFGFPLEDPKLRFAKETPLILSNSSLSGSLRFSKHELIKEPPCKELMFNFVFPPTIGLSQQNFTYTSLQIYISANNKMEIVLLCQNRKR